MHNLTGQKFGRLTVIEQAGRKCGSILWRCKCECGGEAFCMSSNLRNGNSRSCGCLRKENFKYDHTTHGLSATPEYQVWKNMIERCTNPDDHIFHFYGGRGIRVCERWLKSVEDFVKDMGPRPTPKHMIERINNSGNYEPTNCRWATRKEQANNKRNNIRLKLGDTEMTLQQWSEKLGVSHWMLRQRLKLGWSIERALTEPSRYDHTSV